MTRNQSVKKAFIVGKAESKRKTGKQAKNNRQNYWSNEHETKGAQIDSILQKKLVC